MLTINAAAQPVSTPRSAAQAPGPSTVSAFRADSLQLSRRTPPPEVRPTSLGPGAKIALLAAPVVAGAGIGFAVGGPLGALAGAGIGALVSVVGLWWAMTDKPWGNKPDVPPDPPQP